MMRNFLFIAALIGVSACVSNRPGTDSASNLAYSDPAGTARSQVTAPKARDNFLSSDQLRALLVGATLVAKDLPLFGISHPPGEIFEPNGGYIRIVGRVRFGGIYEIAGNLLCVEGGGDFPRQCWRVVPDENGVYIFIDAETGLQSSKVVRRRS
jgi:hypothetical protein